MGIRLAGNRLAYRILITLAISLAASAQPRAVEVWGNIGIANAAGDEGSIGTGAIYGAGVSLPFTSRLAFETNVAGMRAERFAPVTRVLISPALVFRWGHDRLYGFAGGGLGLQIDRGEMLQFDLAPGETEPTITTRRFTDYGTALHGRAGIVAALTPKLIFRAEVFSAWHYVAPSCGVQVGAGYRF